MKAISSADAPCAIGPYSQAIQAGNLLFLSGQIALDPSTKQMITEAADYSVRSQEAEGGGVALETDRVMRNLEAVLKAAGGSFRNVVRTTIYLKDMSTFAIVNGVYARFFEGLVPPARATVEVAALPRGAQVEIDAVAVL